MDEDPDPYNEIQILSKSIDTVKLSNGGGYILLLDDDPVNEIQILSKSADTISLSNGGGYILLLDDDPVNEIQILSKSADTISLSNGGGSVTLLDDDPTNELQTLSVSGNSLSISNGNSISLGDDDWYWSAAGIHHDSLNVGIGGLASSAYRLNIFNDNANTIVRYGARIFQVNRLSSTNYGLYVNNNNMFTGAVPTTYGAYISGFGFANSSGSLYGLSVNAT